MVDDTNKSKAKYITKRANKTPHWMSDTTLIVNTLRYTETVVSMECRSYTLDWWLLDSTKHGVFRYTQHLCRKSTNVTGTCSYTGVQKNYKKNSSFPLA